MEDAIIGIDIGTSSIKCCLFDKHGLEVSTSSTQYGLLNPAPGIFEIDASVLWDAVIQSIKDITGQVSGGKLGKYRIVSAGICAMMVMPVLLDNNYDVIRPVVHWIDERLQKQYYKLKKLGKHSIVSESSGSSLTGESTVNSLAFIKENEPQSYKKIRKFLMIKDFVRFKLTGRVLSDFGDASGTQLLDARKWQWSDTAINELGFDKSFFPQLAKSDQNGGTVTSEAAGITGLPQGIPVAVGSGDGITTIFGLGALDDGQTGVIVGSAGVLASPSTAFPMDKKYRTYIFCHPLADRWFSIMATASSGETFKWYLNSILKNDGLKFEDLDHEASKVGNDLGGLLFLPYILGARNPHSNPNATGVFFGLRHKHKREHLTRAVMEGICLELLEILRVQEEVLCQNNISIGEIKLAGGITKSAFWTQLLADIFQKDIIVTRARQSGALGCAMMASVVCGIYENLQQAANSMVHNERIVRHNENLKDIYDHKFKCFREIYETLKDKFDSISSD